MDVDCQTQGRLKLMCDTCQQRDILQFKLHHTN
jgi:hypothetical protein